jgi:hypothetical protein
MSGKLVFMRLFALLLLIPILTCAISGCGRGGGSSSPVPPDGHRYWTILVYMAADNDLEEYAIRNINDMEKIGSTANVAVVCELDRTPGYDSSNGNWTDTRRFYITKDSDQSVINSARVDSPALGELDMADPVNLTSFVQWGVQNYPADHYMLVMWDHGRGWPSTGLRAISRPRQVRTINIDDTNNSEMSLSALSRGFSSSPTMDVVAFDACLMSMLEVSYSIKDYAHYMLASEDTVPVEGLPYTKILSALTSQPTMGAAMLSSTVVDLYVNAYSSAYNGNITESALDLTAIDELCSSVENFAGVMMENLGTVRAELESAQQSAQRYDLDSNNYRDYKDLYDFARIVHSTVQSVAVQNAAQQVMQSIASTVVDEKHYSAEVANSHGISIYIPGPGTSLTQYNSLAFSQATLWDEFLSAY